MALGLPEDPKQQQRLLIGIVPILLVVGYWYFLHQGFVEEVDALQVRLESLEASNSQARMLAPQSRQLEERLSELERHIDRLEDLVPRSEEVSGLLDRINERAEQIGVELAQFTPGNQDRGNFYNRRTFEMVVHGDYHEIAQFLAEIGSLSRIITPMDLSVIPYTLRGQEAEDATALEATFQIQTYVLPEGAPGGNSGQGGSGA